MITKDEIQAKSLEFGIHQANVQRDYVFGWLLHGLYTATALRDVLVLKGGNCFRKGYFPTTRFSHDLDFSTTDAVDPDLLTVEFNKACAFAEERSGVHFDLDRTRVQVQGELTRNQRIFDVRVYFKDFFGNAVAKRESARLAISLQSDDDADDIPVTPSKPAASASPSETVN